MFPSQKRLKREDFDDALRDGRRVSSQNFKIVIPKKAAGYAVVVSKKTARLSVTRHRIKRQILSALRSFNTLPTSLIVFPQPQVAQMKYQDIKVEISELLSKIKL